MKTKIIQLFSLFCAAVAVGVLGNLQATASNQSDKPNVIVILTDDQGSIDLNCYGATDLKTPNLDKLAQSGVMFTQFYVGSPICSASRASLLTGRTPQGAGLPTNAPSEKGIAGGMPTEKVTIAEVLKKAGYSTGHVGKWHLGYTAETMPLGQGFDYSFGHMGGCIDNFSHFFYWGDNRHDLWENNKEIFADGSYFPDMIEERAGDFIKRNQNNPFFLYLAFNTPHYPMQPSNKWREYYKDLPSPRREYAGLVSTTDERIGKIIDLLDELKIRENTLIIFLSDHGHSQENYFDDRDGGGGGNAGLYRGGKSTLFEGGIRVPAIISWKGTLPEGTVNNQMCMSMDILPTIADFCGVKEVPKEVEGKSIKLVMLEDKASIHDVAYWQFGKQWAVRMGDWKLMGNPVDHSTTNALSFPKDRLFLSNLKKDVSESKNLADQFPQKKEELIGLYEKWAYAIE